MNNKELGTTFEKLVVKRLAEIGYWVHFISPDNSGAQPFDIIAAKNGVAVVGDCKTCKDHIFRLSRLEENQKMAFEKWIACGNTEPLIFIWYKSKIKVINYTDLKREGKVDLDAI